MPYTAGDRVTVRGEQWVVQEATVFSGITLLDLAGAAGNRSAHRRCRLLTPFDRPVATPSTPGIRAVTRRRWMRHLHTQVSERHGFGELRTASRALIDILPFQLEPALAIVRGEASRILLADEVGLGKTIQAGLVLAELRQRGWCEHALVIAPAGLRQQWCDELRQRFDVPAAILDAASVAALADSLPFDVNPWTLEPVAITSIDFVKQTEVLRGLASHLWDLVIVDEAHQAGIASQRYDAVDAIASRARHVMLLTATPHAGDDRAYRALCAIGEIADDDPILLFRRTREMAGLPRSRHVHLLPVSRSAAAREMHRLLDAYLAQLWTIARTSDARDVQLVAMVLAKRAFSCAHALALSLQKRMAGLEGTIDAPAQTMLPLGFEDESDAAPLPIAPAFDRVDEERAVLQKLIDAAHRAEGDDRKISALRRIARRVREPIIIFTEYRDTLETIAAALGESRHVTRLHGGQTAQERRQALQAFRTGEADVLIATDAGSEGLNLHGNCRVVVNLELPWNPIRLEQRIGRVDRIGQTRTVHAINLLAEGTAERRVLASLLRRIDRIRMSEIEIAACVMGGSEPPVRPAPTDPCTTTIHLGLEARTEAHRIDDVRKRHIAGAPLSGQVVPVTVLKSRDPFLIAFFRVRLVTRAGRLIEDTLVPVRMRIDPQAPPLGRSDARALAESLMTTFGRALLRCARTHAEDRAICISASAGRSIARALTRERVIADRVTHGFVLVQAGLFDSRALKEKWAGDERRRAIHRESELRADLLESDAHVHLARDPELVLLLISCCRG